jgi:5-(carboxyamino)imidazole ribonucleotide synthase
MQNKWYGNSFHLGMIGGGQLGRMFIQEAINYDVHVSCLDPDQEAPCSKLASEFVVGSLLDFHAVYAFGKTKDLITVEIENINIEALEKLESEGKSIYPQPRVLKIIQDKGIQKEFYAEHQIPTADFCIVDTTESLEPLKSAFEFPYVQKLRKGGYDGKGVTVLRDASQLDKAFQAPSLLEKMIPFTKELSVIVARNKKGETAVYPTVECDFNPEANLVEFLFSPADIDHEIEIKAQKIAIDVITKLDMVGILAVEFFLCEDGTLLVNEIAPRPHNSGHQTIECNITSQFEQHLRAVLNLPLGSTKLIQPGVMLNLLGEKGYEGSAVYQGLETIMQWEGVKVHLYGKEKTKSFRKMGHITVANESLEKAREIAIQVKDTFKVIA